MNKVSNNNNKASESQASASQVNKPTQDQALQQNTEPQEERQNTQNQVQQNNKVRPVKS